MIETHKDKKRSTPNHRRFTTWWYIKSKKKKFAVINSIVFLLQQNRILKSENSALKIKISFGKGSILIYMQHHFTQHWLWKEIFQQVFNGIYASFKAFCIAKGAQRALMQMKICSLMCTLLKVIKVLLFFKLCTPTVQYQIRML